MGLFFPESTKPPEEQVLDQSTNSIKGLLALYGLLQQGAQNVGKNVGLLAQPDALKEKLLSPVPNYWGNLSNPEARNRLTDIATEQALNFGPLPIASIESAIAKGIQINNKPAFDKLEQRVGLREILSKESKPIGRPYQNVPDSLMGYTPKKPWAQKGYGEQKWPYEIKVKVEIPGMEPFEDGMEGMNKLHALERAQRNWGEDARISILDGWKKDK